MLNFIGEFETKGDLLVTDPCYDPGTWCSGEIKVKPGKYKAYIEKRKIKGWGERVCSLYIVRKGESLKKLSFKKTKIDVGVDSGSAGFFNKELYQKPLSKKIPLIGKKEYELREDLFRIKTIPMDDVIFVNKTMDDILKGKKSNPKEWNLELNKMKKEHNKEIKRIENQLKNIKPKDCDSSDDFDEVCFSLRLMGLGSGVENFGVVSSSGYGDGSYNCYVNKGKEIVASYIKFI